MHTQGDSILYMTLRKPKTFSKNLKNINFGKKCSCTSARLHQLEIHFDYE